MRIIPITCLTACLLLASGAATADPAQVFTCDFESETWWEAWGEKEQDPHTDTVAADTARKFEPAAGKALRIRVDKGGHYGASLAFDFKKRTGSEPEAIYFRYYLRFADDWKPERGGMLPGIGGTYGRAGWGGRKVNGTDGWSARGLFQGLEKGDPARTLRTPVGFYCYHADMKGHYGDDWLWERDGFAGLENNRWYCIEQQVRLNTPGKNDGVLRSWVDGNLVFEKTDVRMRDVDLLKIETVWLNLYYGGTWTAADDYHIYIDDVAISKQPIGTTEESAMKALKEIGAHVFHDARGSKITEVKLNGIKDLSDAVFSHVARFHHLTDLSLEETSISGAALKHIAELKHLEWLNLWKSGIDDAGLAHLSGLRNLDSLPIGGTNITDAGLDHLKSLPRLRYLGVRDTAITDAGVRQLTEFPALLELNLRGTKVTDASIPALCGMMALEKLWLGNTAVTDEGIASIKQALPGCVIVLEPESK